MPQPIGCWRGNEEGSDPGALQGGVGVQRGRREKKSLQVPAVWTLMSSHPASGPRVQCLRRQVQPGFDRGTSLPGAGGAEETGC